MIWSHRCTRVENPGEGVPDVFCQNPWGGSRLSGKIAWVGPTISGFIAYLLTSVLKFAWGGYYIYPPPTSTPPPPCVDLCLKLCFRLWWMLKTTYNFCKQSFFSKYETIDNLLYNKRACPQTMFKILRLRRQRCQIKRITGLPKTWRRERELKIKIGGGETLATHG
jgi:hypothetical protein